ncbi:nucleolar protein 9 [Cloeon dipterum]|uniref:nucleolar protein 9 n=1 Tax=Cloeon dipterum TaxID=197152 RepID=UPI0032203477
MSFEPKYKKKKKKSFISKAKKFGKSGRFGKGSYISEDEYNYFVRVMELDKSEFPSEEDREMFVSNTFEHTVGQEVLLATNQLSSLAIERLIKKGNDECVIRFMEALGADMRPILNDCYASHVFQTLLKKASQRIKEIPENDSKSREDYIAWIIKVGKFLLNNIEDFMWDQYANQIMRTVLEAASGTCELEPESKNTCSDQKLPKALRTFFKDFCIHVQKMPQLNDMVDSVLTSGFLQSLVKCASKASPKLFKSLAESLEAVLSTKKSKNKIDMASWRLIEAILAGKNEEVNKSILDTFFRGNLKRDASDPELNFCVQRLLENCPNKEQLEEIFEELNSAEAIETIILSKHYGVVRAMGEACKNLSTNQGSFSLSLIGALHCNSPSERVNMVASLILAMKDFEKFEHFKMMNEDENSPITLQGSLLLQSCLHFNKPIKFVQSVLSINAEDLVHIFSDPKGSHVCDAFMTSKFVGEKSREKLCSILKGHMATLACNKFGSRSLDSIWKVSPLKTRQAIVSSLSQHLPKLKGDTFGRFVVTNYGVELFKHHPDDWSAAQGKEMTTKRLFADILGEDEPAKKKMKKK